MARKLSVRDLRDLSGKRVFCRVDFNVPLEALAAVEQIGKKDEIPLLLRAYLREDPFTRGRIAVVVRTILKRERIRRNSIGLRSLSAELRRTLEGILVRSARRASRGKRSR